MKKALLICLFVASAFLFISKTHAATLQDDQPKITGNIGGSQCDVIYAQTFTAESSYLATSLALRISTNGNTATSTPFYSVYIVNANSHKPSAVIDNTFLEDYNNLPAYPSTATTTYSLTPQINILEGQEYSIVVDARQFSPNCSPTTGAGTVINGESGTITGMWRAISLDGGDNWTTDQLQNFTFAVYSGSLFADNNLSIESPEQDDQVLSPPSMFGTCLDSFSPLSLQVTPQPCYFGINGTNSTSTPSTACDTVDYIISPISCIGNVWVSPDISLEPGRYDLKLRDSSNASTTRQFFIMDSSGWTGNPGYHPLPGTTTLECNPLVNWSCSLPLVGDFCAAGGVVVNSATCYIANTFKYNAQALSRVKPYGYVFQIYDAFHANLASTTSSSTLPIVELPGNSGNISIVSSSMFDQVPTTTWTFWRNIQDTVIKISFLGYIVSLIL